MLLTYKISDVIVSRKGQNNKYLCRITCYAQNLYLLCAVTTGKASTPPDGSPGAHQLSAHDRQKYRQTGRSRNGRNFRPREHSQGSSALYCCHCSSHSAGRGHGSRPDSDLPIQLHRSAVLRTSQVGIVSTNQQINDEADKSRGQRRSESPPGPPARSAPAACTAPAPHRASAQRAIGSFNMIFRYKFYKKNGRPVSLRPKAGKNLLNIRTAFEIPSESTGRHTAPAAPPRPPTTKCPPYP